MAKKLRVFLVDEKTGKPRPHVVLEIKAEVISQPQNAMITIGMRQSDRVGYLSITIPSDTPPLHLWVTPLGDRLHSVDAVETVYGPLGETVLVMPVAISLLPDDEHRFPSTPDPDASDRELSPGSFSTPPTLTLGQAGCEVFEPNALAERSFSFQQIILDADTPRAPIKAPPGQDIPHLPFVEYRVGALVRYSMDWLPLGHALGEILYSLALVPCESVNLAVIEWSRQDQAERSQDTLATEELNHNQRRDRSIEESVDTALREWQSGSTFSLGASAGVGTVGIGASVSAGASWSSTQGGRHLTGESMQTLADGVVQASSLARSMYSTVVVQASQGERDVVQTRAVTNHNHCHSLTVLYYEVLRQYRVVTRVAAARDVILLKRPEVYDDFDEAFALANRSFLEPNLIDKGLSGCFEALTRRVYEEAPSVGGTTDGTGGADHRIISRMWVYVSSPVPEEGGTLLDTNAISSVHLMLERKDLPTRLTYHVGEGLPASGAPREKLIYPEHWGVESGRGFDKPGYNYYEGGYPGSVSPLILANISRVGIVTEIQKNIEHLDGDEWYLGRVRVEYTLEGDEGNKHLLYDSDSPAYGAPSFPLPYYWRHYSDETAWLSPVLSTTGGSDGQPIDTSGYNRNQDQVCIRRLLGHLNAHKAHYHSVIWMNRHPGEYALEFDMIPFGGGTLFEHAEFRPIAVFGSYVVFPLITNRAESSAATTFAQRFMDDVNQDPVSAYVSLPTRGTFAESKLSECNSCEEIDVTRFWDWTESPCDTQAPAISNISPGSRARDIDTRPSELPGSVLNIVNPPAAPDPTGLAAAMTVMATPNIFRDMSGRQELSSLLQRLSAGTISLAEARQQAQSIQQAQSGSSGAADGSRGSSSRPTARQVHDDNQVVRSAVAHGDITPEEGRAFIRSSTSRVAGDVFESPSLSPVYSEYFTPLPESDRWYEGWFLLYNFAVDDFALTARHISLLDRFIGSMLNSASYRIDIIQGRASQTGPEDGNLDLSHSRGQVVRDYLISHGLDPNLIAALPTPALGSSDPLRVPTSQTDREDPVNRSVIVVYHIMVPSERVPPPVRRPDPTDLPSTEWALRVVLSGAVHDGLGMSISDVHIKNCRTGQYAVFGMTGGGIGAGIEVVTSPNPLQVGDGNWSSFRTSYPASFADFNFEPGFLYTIGASMVTVGAGIGYLRMPFITDQAIELGSSSGIFGDGIEIGGYLDLVVLVDTTDRHTDLDPCPPIAS